MVTGFSQNHSRVASDVASAACDKDFHMALVRQCFAIWCSLEDSNFIASYYCLTLGQGEYFATLDSILSQDSREAKTASGWLLSII